MPDAFPPLLLDDDDLKNDPDLAWYGDEGGGGYQLPFGTHIGRRVNEVSESYLMWAKTHLKERYGVHRSVTRTLGAIEAYVEGLEGCLDEWFADFIVPCGVHYRGRTIRRCSDRAWLSWVVGRDRVRRSHPLFVKAVKKWLGSKTRLKSSADPTTFLSPARYHADLRKFRSNEGEPIPDERDLAEDDVETPRSIPKHADSDTSITDPEDEKTPSSPSPAYRPHSRGSSRNFVVADDRVSVSTDDSAYGELERAESLLRSAQKQKQEGSQKKKRRRSSKDDHDESPSKRRARHQYRIESTTSFASNSKSSASNATSSASNTSRASSSSPSPTRGRRGHSSPPRRRRRDPTPDGSPAHFTRSQARIAQEPESPGPHTRARAAAASQARQEDATSSLGAAGVSLAARRPASWSASASTAPKRSIRTYGRRAATLSERLARLVDPTTPEPDETGVPEGGGGAHAEMREEEEEESFGAREGEAGANVTARKEEEEEEEGVGAERVEDYVSDSEGEDEGLLRAKGGPTVEGSDPIKAAHGGNGRRLVFSHVELPTRPRRSSSPPPAVTPRRSSRSGKRAPISQIRAPRSSSRAEGPPLSSQTQAPTSLRLVFSHVEIPSPSWRDTPSASTRKSRSTGTRNNRGFALESIGRKRRRQSAPDELTAAEVKVTRAAARRHSPPPTASRSSSPSGTPSSRSPSRQPVRSSPPRSRSTTPPAPVERSSSISAHLVASPQKRRSVSPSRAHREQKRAKVEADNDIPRRTRSSARLGQPASALSASQASARPIPIFSLLTEDEEVEDSEGEATITISAGVRDGPVANSTRITMVSASAPVAGPFSRAVERLRSQASSRKSSASATPSSAAKDPRSSATKIASSSTAVASSSFVGSRPPSTPRPSVASDATGLRARFPNVPSSVLAARMRGVVEEVPRDPTPEGEWEWYLDEFDILVKRAVVQERPRASTSKERDKG